MPQNRRLASFLRPCSLIWFSIRQLLTITSEGFIAFESTTIVPTLLASARCVVLELGPGAGNQIHRFDLPHITRIYGIEPNPFFTTAINTKIEKHGLKDKYKLLVCGVEERDALEGEGVREGMFDVVVCIQVLCAVEDVRGVVGECWRLLRPGGKFVFWEHGGSRDVVTRGVQALLNPAWSTFVGCHLTRNVLKDILDGGEWENPEDIEEPEDPYSCLPRIQGVLVKKA
ncbi:S-adenosyl-L-methionine-dependent methyltransferase [Hyaloscypha variabilis F]|uniref:S-adenosyl-L-methionine-dependent methyltransferase n=1 Tax=Hyaloscypha variabilis (strain UAMH 11265 / GT02V1 / F) TaxID=1149755 RepID=A0A2J6S8W9_HYAVF|nr:S-adenosyl-L-methionine-dependent methyltransferase [Hyaloscypha variabilis F]